MDRLLTLIQEKKLWPDLNPAPLVLVATWPDLEKEAWRRLIELRRRGIKSEIYLGAKQKLAKQIQYANERKIRYLLIVGPDEAKAGKATLKDLFTGQQETLAPSKLWQRLKT